MHCSSREREREMKLALLDKVLKDQTLGSQLRNSCAEFRLARCKCFKCFIEVLNCCKFSCFHCWRKRFYSRFWIETRSQCLANWETWGQGSATLVQSSWPSASWIVSLWPRKSWKILLFFCSAFFFRKITLFTNKRWLDHGATHAIWSSSFLAQSEVASSSAVHQMRLLITPWIIYFLCLQLRFHFSRCGWDQEDCSSRYFQTDIGTAHSWDEHFWHMCDT